MTSHLLLVRHADAKPRSTWEGSDLERTLNGRGREQARAIGAAFAPWPVDRVLSSAAVRCVDTVSGLAAARGLTVERVPWLFEGSQAEGAEPLVPPMGRSWVACSHGDVVPALLAAYEVRHPQAAAEPEKGSTWLLVFDQGRCTTALYVDAP